MTPEERAARIAAMTPEERQEYVERLHMMIFAPDVYDMLEEYSHYIVVCTDLETGHQTYAGPFPDVPSAMAYAEKHETEVNRGMEKGDLPWKCVVKPMFRPDE